MCYIKATYQADLIRWLSIAMTDIRGLLSVYCIAYSENTIYITAGLCP